MKIRMILCLFVKTNGRFEVMLRKCVLFFCDSSKDIWVF